MEIFYLSGHSVCIRIFCQLYILARYYSRRGLLISLGIIALSHFRPIKPHPVATKHGKRYAIDENFYSGVHSHQEKSQVSEDKNSGVYCGVHYSVCFTVARSPHGDGACKYAGYVHDEDGATPCMTGQKHEPNGSYSL